MLLAKVLKEKFVKHGFRGGKAVNVYIGKGKMSENFKKGKVKIELSAPNNG